MSSILILIIRNFKNFKKDIGINLLLYFLFPLFVYLFLVSPLTNLFNGVIPSSRMSYTYHSVPAVVFLCTSIFAILIPLVIINQDSKNNFLSYIFTTGINSNYYFLSVIIYSFICAFLEFVVSLFLIIQLSDSGDRFGLIISWNQIFNLSIIICLSILFFSNLGLLLSNFLRKIEHILISLIFIFLIISFGSASFIPIDYYSESFGAFINSYNIIFLLFDMFISTFNPSNGINLGVFIVSIFISMIFYFLNLIIYKKMVTNY